MRSASVARLGGELAFVERDEIRPALEARVELGEKLHRLGVARNLPERALVGARRALLIGKVLGIHAREPHGGADALLGSLGAIGESLEHARDLFPFTRSPMHELEQASRLLVRRVEAHGLLEPLDRRR